jgi:hypothetical protein
VTQTTQKKRKDKDAKMTENSSNPAKPDKAANRKNFNRKSNNNKSDVDNGEAAMTDVN